MLTGIGRWGIIIMKKMYIHGGTGKDEKSFPVGAITIGRGRDDGRKEV